MKRFLSFALGLLLLLALAGYLLATYGAVAFSRRDVGLYLLLKSHFVFYDYSEPVAFFLLDYLAVMGLFVLVGKVMQAKVE